MLLRYKNMIVKPEGVFVVIPFEARKSHSLTLRSKKVLLNPFGEVPDRDAKLYASSDPTNFELVKEGDAAEAVTEPEAEGLELDADPVKTPKKRGRKPKVQSEPQEDAA